MPEYYETYLFQQNTKVKIKTCKISKSVILVCALILFFILNSYRVKSNYIKKILPFFT